MSAGSARRCSEAGIAFDVNSEGTKVLVAPGQTAQARMLLAEKGLPSSANAGYELFDKLGSIGLTSFMQEITRVRALEGEIARTIQAMKGVQAPPACTSCCRMADHFGAPGSRPRLPWSFAPIARTISRQRKPSAIWYPPRYRACPSTRSAF